MKECILCTESETRSYAIDIEAARVPRSCAGVDTFVVDSRRVAGQGVGVMLEDARRGEAGKSDPGAPVDPREDAVRRILEQIARGAEPRERTLREAPHLADWSWQPHPIKGVEVLWGNVTGHARLGRGMIYTGRVWAMAVDRSWVLTTSRFYRLGEPAR